MKRYLSITILCLILPTLIPQVQAEGAFLQRELIFPMESWHNHGSCIIECPNGDMLLSWFPNPAILAKA
jgi:hypothetical protein